VPSVLTAAVAQLKTQAITASVFDRQLALELYVLANGLDVLANEYDVCAARRVEEIAELSDLLARGAKLSPGRFSWAGDLDGATGDLKISALEAHLDVLRAHLIELQAWLETSPGEQAAEILDELFRFEYNAATKRAPKAALW